MSEEIKTVELTPEPETAAVAKPETITRAELKEKGWSQKEMDSAEKHGMIEKTEEKSPPTEKTTAQKPVGEVTPPAGTPSAVPPLEKKPEGELPDFTFKTPEQEKVFLDAFGAGTPQRAMYFRMKNERLARQRAESDRDRLNLELQMEKDKQLKLEERIPEVDANGNVVDPDDKPLTMKQLRAMQQEEIAKINKQRAEIDERSYKVADAMKAQEEYAKSTLPDFDETVKLAKELVDNIEQIPENWKKHKIVKLLQDLKNTASTADQYGVDDYTAPMIAYEMGQLHPNYGKTKTPADTNGVDPKGHGTLTPEQMKRMEENTQRRASSASLPGSSGRRVVSVDDITIKDVLRMSPEDRYKFKKDHPEKMRKLLRG